MNCTKGRCIHGSFVKSFVGTAEALFWKWMGVYKQIDTIICPSRFIQSMLDTDPILAERTVVLHNFVDSVVQKKVDKKDYVLYFGRYSEEKGIATLVQAAKELPSIQFVFAGSGPLDQLLTDVPNIKNVGFQTGEALETLIREARFSVYPSEWYENCPFSIMESIMYGTPVLGADIGGIPELIRVGETGGLFESGNVGMLSKEIQLMWGSLDRYQRTEEIVNFLFANDYSNELVKRVYS